MDSIEGEEWRAIHNCEGHKVSTMGRVFFPERMIMTRNSVFKTYKSRIYPSEHVNPTYSIIAYYDSNRKKHCVPIHRLIAREFCVNPHNNPCINHKNSVAWDNRACNLEWVTHSQNLFHAHMVKDLPKEDTFGVFDDEGYNFSKQYIACLKMKEPKDDL